MFYCFYLFMYYYLSYPLSICVSRKIRHVCNYNVGYFLWIVAPHITPFAFEGEANTGDSAQIGCYVSKGDAPLTISWSLNNHTITPHWGISIVPIGSRTSLLTIASVTADHAGVYSCKVENKAGIASNEAELLVNGT